MLEDAKLPLSEAAADHTKSAPRRERSTGKQKPFRSVGEAFNIAEQADVLSAIEEVDLTPRPNCGERNLDYPEPSNRSVIKPGLKTPLPAEYGLKQMTSIDRDCDQIRTMIKQFTSGGEWTIDQFRLAMYDVYRKQLTAFLEKSGPKGGNSTIAYQLAWDFFNRREQLGLPLTAQADSGEALQERDVNRGRKRRSDGGEPGRSTKHVKA